MTAIRIIDDHLELASIGTNTHAQIDTHIAAADNYVKRDGSLALTSDWDIGDGRKILADEIRARDGAGLKLYDDGGNGIFVEDGGDVGMGTDTPRTANEIYNTSTGTADLPGGLNSRNIALLLRSDASAAGSRPGIVQYGLRTAGSGIAYDINTAFIGSAEANVLRATTIGVYGEVGASSHTVNYTYLDSRSAGAWNNATLKIDSLNRVGIGLTTSVRPSGTLHVYGTTYLMNGDVGIGTITPSSKLHIIDDISGYGNFLTVEDITDPGSGATIINLKNSVSELQIRAYGSGSPGILAGAVGLIGTANSMVHGVGAGKNMHLYSNNNYSSPEFTINADKIGLKTTAPTALLDINSDILRLRTAKTPATAGAAGNQGDWCWDATHIYVCTSTNSWKRAAIAAW